MFLVCWVEKKVKHVEESSTWKEFSTDLLKRGLFVLNKEAKKIIQNEDSGCSGLLPGQPTLITTPRQPILLLQYLLGWKKSGSRSQQRSMWLSHRWTVSFLKAAPWRLGLT